jgi:hypothetical protein
MFNNTNACILAACVHACLEHGLDDGKSDIATLFMVSGTLRRLIDITRGVVVGEMFLAKKL